MCYASVDEMNTALANKRFGAVTFFLLFLVFSVVFVLSQVLKRKPAKVKMAKAMKAWINDVGYRNVFFFCFGLIVTSCTAGVFDVIVLFLYFIVLVIGAVAHIVDKKIIHLI